LAIYRPTHRSKHQIVTSLPVELHGHHYYTAGKITLPATSHSQTHTSALPISHANFAKALIPLFSNVKAIGGAFNITSDEVLNWKEATDILVDILNIRNLEYLYIPTEYVCKYLEYLQPLKTEQKDKFCPSLEHSLSHMATDFKSQKMWCDLFDNSKIKSFVPHWKPKVTLSEGLKETIQWMNEKEERKRFDPKLNEILDGLTEKFKFYLK